MHEPDAELEQLMSLGVSATIARKAMRLHPGDVESAANYCLDSAPRHKAVCLSQRDHVVPSALVFDLVSGGVRLTLVSLQAWVARMVFWDGVSIAQI